MTVEFSNTQAAVWNAIQTSLCRKPGSWSPKSSALDKKQGSFKAGYDYHCGEAGSCDHRPTSPTAGLEERFESGAHREDSAWDFVQNAS